MEFYGYQRRNPGWSCQQARLQKEYTHIFKQVRQTPCAFTREMLGMERAIKEIDAYQYDSRNYDQYKANVLAFVTKAVRFLSGSVPSFHASALFAIACEQGDAEPVRMMLRHGARANARIDFDGEYRRPLVVASERGLVEVVKVLVGSGAGVNDFDEVVTSKGAKVKEWPLLMACKNGHFELARFLLKCGSTVHDRTFEFQPQPLHYVCQYSSKEAQNMAAEVIMEGAEVDSVMVHKSTLRGLPVQLYHSPLETAVHFEKSVMIYTLVALCGNLALQINTCNTIRNYIYSNVLGDTYLTKEFSPIIRTRSSPEFKWTPHAHWQFPKLVRDSVMSLLLIAKRQRWNLDSAVLQHIIGYVCFGWLKNCT